MLSSMSLVSRVTRRRNRDRCGSLQSTTKYVDACTPGITREVSPVLADSPPRASSVQLRRAPARPVSLSLRSQGHVRHSKTAKGHIPSMNIQSLVFEKVHHKLHEAPICFPSLIIPPTFWCFLSHGVVSVTRPNASKLLAARHTVPRVLAAGCCQTWWRSHDRNRRHPKCRCRRVATL